MSSYDSIKVLSSVEHIRKRPHMYISSYNPSYQMFDEILSNSADEAINGHCNKIVIDIDYKSHFIRIQDNGRGLPQSMDKKFNKSSVELIYTYLNAGGKFDDSNYDISSGLHGAGSCVVNALSRSLHVKTWRKSSVVDMHFEEGNTTNYIQYKDSVYKDTGTLVEYTIDVNHKLFTDKLKDYEEDIENKISLLKTLMPHVTFIYNSKEMHVRDFREFLILSKEPLLKESILISQKNLMVSLNWSKDTNKSTQRTYCNSIYTPNGGDHEKAVYDALTDVLGSDSLYGINIAVSSMYPSVEYDSQAKTKAISKDMREWEKGIVIAELKSYFRKNPNIKESVEELIKKKRNDLSKRNNKSAVRRDKKSTFLNALGATAFADCTTKDRSEAELFITEGNSAAGSARQARNVETQAVAPLRGKFINAYTADVASLLKNAEVGMLLSSIDCGMFDDVNVNKSRYGKIIIFSDADEDGKDIACLLISFFMKVLPDLVRHGYLYLSLPPLYGTHDKSGKFIPINSEEEREEYQSKGYTIQRYKGLGEMSPEQLKVSCMDPATRKIVQITYSDNCEEYIEGIMGGDSSKRKQLLIDRGVLSI